MSYYGRRMTDEELMELRRKASANLTQIYQGRGKLKPDREGKKSELQKASAWEIQLGYDVLQRREFSKRFNQLMRRKKLDREGELEAEELQGMIDTLDARLDDYNRAELSRFVRLWNKSQKQRYKL